MGKGSKYTLDFIGVCSVKISVDIHIAPSKIAGVNLTTNSWNEPAQELHITITSELVITPYPVTSLNCVDPSMSFWIR